MRNHQLRAAAGSSGATVTITGTSQSNSTANPTRCYCNINLDSDGDWYESIATGLTNGVNLGTWLTTGTNAQVWVEMTFNSGDALTTSSGTSRIVCSTDRAWGIDGTNPTPKVSTFTLDFYDAASGGNLLDSAQFTVSAESAL